MKYLTILVILVITFTSCKEEPIAIVEDNYLVGTWKDNLAGTWTFNEPDIPYKYGQGTFRQFESAKSTFFYSVEGNVVRIWDDINMNEEGVLVVTGPDICTIDWDWANLIMTRQ